MLEELHKVEIEKLLKIKTDFLSFSLYVSVLPRDLLNDLRRAHGIEISDQTVRNRLKEANLKP
jgi:hypothetical protein